MLSPRFRLMPTVGRRQETCIWTKDVDSETAGPKQGKISFRVAKINKDYGACQQ